MRISHSDAIMLESIVRSVHSCDRSGMGGYIDADHFESEPFDAALIALAPIWKNYTTQTLDEFLYRWEFLLRKEHDETVDINEFIDELKDMVGY